MAESYLRKIANSIVSNVTTSLRHFTAFVFIVYAVGVMVGMHVANSGNASYQFLAIGAPIALAALSFVSTSFAVAVFIVMAVFLFFI